MTVACGSVLGLRLLEQSSGVAAACCSVVVAGTVNGAETHVCDLANVSRAGELKLSNQNCQLVSSTAGLTITIDYACLQ